MKNLIDRIIESDIKARGLKKAALDEKQAIANKTAAEIKKIREKSLALAETELKDFAEAEKKALEAGIAKIDGEYALKTERLRRNFEENRSVWAAEIFNNVVNNAAESTAKGADTHGAKGSAIKDAGKN